MNLPADVTPSAADAITLAPAWPLNLEQSLLAAYDNNPELDAILATRRALALQQDETAAQLLPQLSLFASVGGLASVERLRASPSVAADVAAPPSCPWNRSPVTTGPSDWRSTG